MDKCFENNIIGYNISGEPRSQGRSQRKVFFLLVFDSDHELTNQRFVNCAYLKILSALVPALPCLLNGGLAFVYQQPAVCSAYTFSILLISISTMYYTSMVLVYNIIYLMLTI